MKIYNGVAGCGKSLIIKEQIENLIKNGTNPHKILILCLNHGKKDMYLSYFKYNSVQILSFNELLVLLEKKSCQKINRYKISDFAATNIIKWLCEKDFKNNYALNNLCKSLTFSRELYNLFGLFKVNSLSFEMLSEITKNCNIPDEDKKRFEIILNIYKKYCTILKENNFADYKDLILDSFDELKNNQNLKNIIRTKYEYIFVDGAQNITQIQLELLKQFANEEKFFLFGDENAKIQSFMGANAFNPQNYDNETTKRNNEILKRALFITGKSISTEKCEDIEYRLFFDLQSEIAYIAKNIIKELEKGANINDFAILIRDNSIKQNITEYLREYNLPVSGILQSEDFRFLKQNFLRLTSLFEIAQKLSVPEFDKNGFEQMKISSVVDLEIYSQEANLLIENILRENLQNKYLYEKIYRQNEKEKNPFILQTVYKHLDWFNENDKIFINNFLNKLKELYAVYKKSDYSELIIKIAQPDKNFSEEYNVLLASVISNLNEMINLKKTLFNETIDLKSVLNLFELNLNEEDDEAQSGIKILTMFKALGTEFKYVYIPNLIEGYFPKKIKTTQFISSFANEELSKAIKNKNPNFEKIIFSQRDEQKDEEHLMYTAMTRAKKKIFLSTHLYEDKQQIMPSSFFEQLHFADERNFVSDEIKKLEEYIECDKEDKKDETNINNLPVLNSNESITLSASSIAKFLACPRKFYLLKLLGIKEETDYAANYGQAIHAVFELLLSKYLAEFSKNKALELGNILFNAKNDYKMALDTGFKDYLIEDTANLSDLIISEMKESFYSAMDELETKGYFAQKPQSADCEIKFNFTVDEIKNITFKGFIDAIIKDNSGYNLVDYKTGGDKISPAKLFTPEEINFLIKKGENTRTISVDKIRNFEYQLPLYYLALLYSDELEKYKNQISAIGYRYIRPTFLQGCKDDFIETEKIDTFKDTIIANLKKYIVEEMYSKTKFEPLGNYFECKKCGFKSVCCSDEQGEDE